MSVPNKRHRLDQLSTVLIRGTSVLVLLLVLGMLLQMLGSTLPLFDSVQVVPAQPRDNARVSAAGGLAPRPAWVPSGPAPTAWYNSSTQRVWVQLEADGTVAGERLLPTDGPGDWHSQPLSVSRQAVGADYIELVAAGNKVLALDSAGRYQLWALGGVQADIKQPPVTAGYTEGRISAYRAVKPTSGKRAWLLLLEDAVEQIHLVQRDDGLVLEPLWRSASGAALIDAEPSLVDQRVLLARADGALELWSATTGRRLARWQAGTSVAKVGWLSRDQVYALSADGERMTWTVTDPAKGVSLATLFTPQQYQGYGEPSAVWQPTAASDGYEVKMSVLPLLQGTLKAALLALLLALPLAVGAAVFVGFFMTPTWRDRIKPSIEMIAAFPTVVVGAVAAVWLAPRLLDVLMGLVGIVLCVPPGIALLAVLWRRHTLAQRTTYLLGQLPFLLLPPLVLLMWLGWQGGFAVERALFDGSIVDWLYRHYGLNAQHRNAILVGVALGFAIIPTIFTVAEDAIHAVPRAAAAGSLALGATQWQSFRDVVLPVAMPGILSGVMLGFGRAIGETMILLLVSGNAPLDSWNLLEGLRSLSATLAIELPESLVGSPHYRVLFLAALLLFGLTFISNTIAQLLRRHLRRRYGFDL